MRSFTGIVSACLVAVVLVLAGAQPSLAQGARGSKAVSDPTVPLSGTGVGVAPAIGGAVPTLGRAHDEPLGAGGSQPGNVYYNGGLNGLGVVSAAPKVYLVFWGSQWGSESVNANGYAAFSGDPKGMAPRLQAFFAGLGTGDETWSGIMTQYCQGVAPDAQSCPSSPLDHVGYPTGGALAGVWEDTSAAAPATPSFAQIATEAEAAAAHFANTSPSTNFAAQYVVVSPTGIVPLGFPPSGQDCAWHSWVSSTYGDVLFTNLPYLPDAGSGCGEYFVNPGPAGTLDGVTIVAGHEYAETITDPIVDSGWTDSAGAEVADKCTWIASGPGAAFDLSLATGQFAVQSIWANDANGGAGGCETSHPIIGGLVAGFTLSPASPVPGGAVVTFTSDSTYNLGSIVSYAWSINGVPAAGGTLPTLFHSFPAPPYPTVATDKVTLKVQDSAGQVATVSKTIQVAPHCTPAICRISVRSRSRSRAG